MSLTAMNFQNFRVGSSVYNMCSLIPDTYVATGDLEADLPVLYKRENCDPVPVIGYIRPDLHFEMSQGQGKWKPLALVRKEPEVADEQQEAAADDSVFVASKEANPFPALCPPAGALQSPSDAKTPENAAEEKAHDEQPQLETIEEGEKVRLLNIETKIWDPFFCLSAM